MRDWMEWVDHTDRALAKGWNITAEPRIGKYLSSAKVPFRIKGEKVFVRRWVQWLWDKPVHLGSKEEMEPFRLFRKAKTNKDVEALLVMRGLAK